MTQIKYNRLEESLKPLATKELPQIVLLWGEKYLTAAKADFIVSNLISKKEREVQNGL